MLVMVAAWGPGAGVGLESHVVAPVEGTEPVGGEGGLVREHDLGAVVSGNEA